MLDEAAKSDEPHSRRSTIDSTFRNGSLTAIGVVVGFSLGFLSRWAEPRASGRMPISSPSRRSRSASRSRSSRRRHAVGQISILTRYNRSVRIFLVGLVLVATGVAAAIFADLAGIGGIALRS